ncbi:hypothetical protein JKP88DRAFT_244312 [Tribonema minus]|uniref:Response regulatory domain-containing protein n=1 Tax=Tribonema minus TaxID=303371 RepID=A0A835Z616_9STRA|nr:hypothetical protein JKP88DRAFT_244312 [Tribonema minus]
MDRSRVNLLAPPPPPLSRAPALSAATGRLEWSTALLRFKHAEADRAHRAHKSAFRRFNLGLVCTVLSAAEGVALANALARRDWIGVCQFAAVVAALLSIMRATTGGAVSERAVSRLCIALTALLHAAFATLLVGNAVGFARWSLLRQGVTPLSLNATFIMVADFMLAPYWFTNVLIGTPISIGIALQVLPPMGRGELESALEAVRRMCMAAAVAYMVHASILELFASPTQGLLRALALGVRAEKELYISQVRCECKCRGNRSVYLNLKCTSRWHSEKKFYIMQESYKCKGAGLALGAMNAIRTQALDAAAYSEGHTPSPVLSNGSVRVLTKRCANFTSADLAAETPTLCNICPNPTSGRRRAHFMSADLAAGPEPAPQLWSDSTGGGAGLKASRAASSAKAAPIDWQCRVDDAVAQEIATDFSWLQDMLLQLMSNAKKHANGTRVVITTVSLTDDGTQLRFGVRDFGVGLPQHSSLSIWDKFTRGRTPGTLRGGLSLGLHGMSVKAAALGGACGIVCPAAAPCSASHGSSSGVKFWFSIPYIPVVGSSPSSGAGATDDASDRRDTAAAAAARGEAAAAAAARSELQVPPCNAAANQPLKGASYKLQERQHPCAQANTQLPRPSRLPALRSACATAAALSVCAAHAPTDAALSNVHSEGCHGPVAADHQAGSAAANTSASASTAQATAATACGDHAASASGTSCDGASARRRARSACESAARSTEVVVETTQCSAARHPPQRETFLAPPLLAAAADASDNGTGSASTSTSASAAVGDGALMRTVERCDALSSSAADGRGSGDAGGSVGGGSIGGSGGGGSCDGARLSAPSLNLIDGEAKPLVLVVDDDATLRRFLARMLGTRGYDVVVACDGAEGLEAMKACAFAAVLLDLNMPRLSGIETLAALRAWEKQQSPPPPQQQQQPPPRRRPQFVVVISANCSEAQAAEALSAGADLFHSKPIHLPSLNHKYSRCVVQASEPMGTRLNEKRYAAQRGLMTVYSTKVWKLYKARTMSTRPLPMLRTDDAVVYVLLTRRERGQATMQQKATARGSGKDLLQAVTHRLRFRTAFQQTSTSK